jgi:micrococcal nuclease
MRKWASLVLAAVLCMTTVGCGSAKQTSAKNREDVKVERVVDGDTFEVNIGGKKEKVRLIGVDTPETKKPNTPVMYYGKEASDYTKKRLEHKTVTLEWDIDKRDTYQRLLAYVWINDECFNRTLVKEGFARIATFPPNVKYVDLFKKDQEEARKKNKGLWKNYEKAFDK